MANDQYWDNLYKHGYSRGWKKGFVFGIWMGWITCGIGVTVALLWGWPF